jgi:hypothetical protein
MSPTNDALPRWTETDTEGLFSTLGKYWIIFQAIEAQLDQILLLAWDVTNWAASQKKLAAMSNAQKVEAFEAEVFNSPDFKRVHTRPEWLQYFRSVVARLHEERRLRNAMIHSHTLFDFADKGLGAPLMSSRRKQEDSGGAMFDQQWLTREFQDAMLGRLGNLTSEIICVCTQLRHDYRADVQ